MLIKSSHFVWWLPVLLELIVVVIFLKLTPKRVVFMASNCDKTTLSYVYAIYPFTHSSQWRPQKQHMLERVLMCSFELKDTPLVLNIIDVILLSLVALVRWDSSVEFLKMKVLCLQVSHGPCLNKLNTWKLIRFK